MELAARLFTLFYWSLPSAGHLDSTCCLPTTVGSPMLKTQTMRHAERLGTLSKSTSRETGGIIKDV